MLDPACILVAHVCKHRLCSQCWFQLGSDDEENEVLLRNFCGGRVCLVQNAASGSNPLSASGSNPLSTPPVPRPNRHGMPLWRRHVEGIRLIESILHESTRKFMINMHQTELEKQATELGIQEGVLMNTMINILEKMEKHSPGSIARQKYEGMLQDTENKIADIRSRRTQVYATGL